MKYAYIILALITCMWMK